MADYVSQFTGAEIDSRLRKAGTAVQPADLESKQDTLVSGENIKTINGQSVVGSGNIQIQAGDTDAVKYVEQTLTDAQKTQARTNIGAAAASALSALETAIAAKYSKPSGGIPETDLASGVQSALALARTSIQSLADYYSKTEVDALLEAVGSEQYVDVTTLPTASASTLGKIYLVGPDANGFYDRYYTSYDGSTYSWVAAGNTEINLANYATKAELSQLQQEVHNLSGKYYGLFTSSAVLPSEITQAGYAFVGSSAPFAIWNFDGTSWSDTGATVDAIHGEDGVGFESVASQQDGTIVITLTNRDTVTIDLNHSHPQYYSKAVESEQPPGGFLPDVIYKLGTLTGSVTFVLAAAVTGNLNHYFWMFDTGGTVPTVIWPSGITWAAGSAPTVAANKHYEVSILGGIAYYSEV